MVRSAKKTAAPAGSLGAADEMWRAAPGTRARQAQDTRATILKAAIKVFARDGYEGGRIEKISRLARSHDRMIYYYFGSKEKLFVEVLETIYAELNIAESKLVFDLERPLDAIETLVHFTWKYYLAHPEFVTILNSENLHRGQHARKSVRLGSISAVALSILAEILQRGQQQGLIRPDITAHQVYLMIASLGYFYNSNRYTLSAFLEVDLMDKKKLLDWETFITATVMRAVAPPALAKASAATPRKRSGQ